MTDSNIINSFNNIKEYFLQLGVEIKPTPSGFIIGRNPEQFITVETVQELKAAKDVVEFIKNLGVIQVKDTNGKSA